MKIKHLPHNSGVSENARRLYGWLQRLAGTKPKPSLELLASKCQIGKTTARFAFGELVERRFVEIEREANGKIKGYNLANLETWKP